MNRFTPSPSAHRWHRSLSGSPAWIAAVAVLVLAVNGCSQGTSGGPTPTGSGGGDAGSPSVDGAAQTGSGGAAPVGSGGGGTPLGTGGSFGGGSGGLTGSAGAGTGGALSDLDAGADAASGSAADGSAARDSGIDAGSDRQPRMLNAVMVIAGGGVTTAGDKVMIARLVARGIRVTPIGDATVTAAAVTGMDLVVISSSAESGPLGVKVRDVPVPIVCIENGAYPFMKMAGPTLNTDFGAALTQTQVAMSGVTDPLAAGLTGRITISSVPGDLGWAVPGPAAIRAATIVGNTAHAALFGYAAGDQMVGMVAPARRVGFAIREILAANLSGDGIKLFDAAVSWALQ